MFQPSIILIRNSNKILNSTKINENSKLFLISDNPKINKKIFSYYFGIQTNYATKQDHIKSVNFKNFNIKKRT